MLNQWIDSIRRELCLLANLNSLAYDFVARQKVGGLHLNFFIVEQLPTLRPTPTTKNARGPSRRSWRTGSPSAC